MRIASLLASGTEIVCGLGLGEQLVAISHECDYPAEVLDRPRVTRARIDDHAAAGDIDRMVRAAAEQGSALYDIDHTALAALEPDVIITQSHCAVCAVNLDDVRQLIEITPTLQHTRIVDLNPMTLDGVYADIRAVGAACRCEQRAEAFVENLRARTVAISRRTKPLEAGERPEVLCLEWTDPPMVSGNWMPELIDLAGGRCGLGVAGGRSPQVAWSDIIASNPQAIVVMPCGFDLARSTAEARALKRVDGWRDLEAVRRGRVYAVDGNAYFNRSGPRLVDSLEILARVVHPELFGAPDEAEALNITG